MLRNLKERLQRKRNSTGEVVAASQSGGHEDDERTSSQVTTSSIYRKLKSDETEIRLLLVKAGRPKEPIRCVFDYTSLLRSDPKAYETVSYVWGDANLRCTVQVQDCQLSVPASSEAVLRHFRKPKADRLLWIDAICINQDDSEERSQQVALMGAIYSKTFNNLIWLGEPECNHGDRTFRSIYNIHRTIQRRTNNFERFLETVLDVETGRYRFSELNGLDRSDDYVALLQIYRSKWFTRLWVVQEAALAPESQCHFGDEWIDLITLTRVAAWFSYHRQTLHVDFSKERGLANAALMWEYVDTEQGPLSKKSGFHGNFLRFLQGLRSFNATHPKDHIFALLGLYMKIVFDTIDPKDISPLLEPDQSRPLTDVLRDATIHVLLEDQTLDYFTWLGIKDGKDGKDGKDREIDQPPSWVPRWDVEKDLEQAITPLASSFRSCSQHTKTSIRDVLRSGTWPDKNILSLNGIVIDTISKTWTNNGLGSQRATADDCLRSIKEIQSALSDDSTSLTMMASTLIAATDHHRRPIDPSTASQHFKAWLTYLDKKKKRPLQLVLLSYRWSASSEAERAAYYENALLRAWINRTLFFTSGGRLGLGPRPTEEGDIVSVLWGCKWPVVIRPITGTAQCTVLGPAYVHGVMNGEAVGAHEATGAPEEVFHLR